MSDLFEATRPLCRSGRGLRFPLLCSLLFARFCHAFKTTGIRCRLFSTGGLQRAVFPSNDFLPPGESPIGNAGAMERTHRPTVGHEYGYRFVEARDTRGGVWMIERGETRFVARRARLSDPETQGRMRLRQAHSLPVVDVIEDGEWMWLVHPAYDPLPSHSISGDTARLAALALVSVWCDYRDLGLVAFPLQPHFGLSASQTMTVLSCGTVQRVSGDTLASGWLALLSCLDELVRQSDPGFDVRVALATASFGDNRERIGRLLVASWEGIVATEQTIPAPLASESSESSTTSSGLRFDEVRGLMSLVETTTHACRSVLGRVDDVLSDVDAAARRRVAVRAESAARRKRGISPFLVSVLIGAVLVAAAVVVL